MKIVKRQINQGNHRGSGVYLLPVTFLINTCAKKIIYNLDFLLKKKVWLIYVKGNVARLLARKRTTVLWQMVFTISIKLRIVTRRNSVN